MLYGTGLRRGELELLNLDAFDRTEGTLRIDGRKTGHQRCVPLPEMVLRCLEAYLPLRHNQLEQAGSCGECALLVSRSGQRLTGAAISNGIHAISRRAQVPIHSLHQFRHSCASDLLESGVHLAQVQRILGHCGIGTTVRYASSSHPSKYLTACLAACIIAGMKLFTTGEAASKVGVSRQTLYSWIALGLIAAPKPLRAGVRLWTASQIASAAKAKGKLKRGPVPRRKGGAR